MRQEEGTSGLTGAGTVTMGASALLCKEQIVLSPISFYRLLKVNPKVI
jgi:hypothetical protein